MANVDPNAPNFLDRYPLRWPLFGCGLLTMLLGLYGLSVAGGGADPMLSAGGDKPDAAAAPPSNLDRVDSTAGGDEANQAEDTVPELSFPSPRSPAVSRASSRGGVSFRDDVGGEPRTPAHPAALSPGSRASSRSSMAIQAAAPVMQRQSLQHSVSGSFAEVLFHNRMSKAILNESLNGADVGQNNDLAFGQSFMRPSMTPVRKSMARASTSPTKASDRSSWSRRGSSEAVVDTTLAPGEAPAAIEMPAIVPKALSSPKRNSLYRITTVDKLPAEPEAAAEAPASEKI